jgi:hypothetical protein
LAQASQRCRRNSPACVPSQKCRVSGVGFGFARAGVDIEAASLPDWRLEAFGGLTAADLARLLANVKYAK